VSGGATTKGLTVYGWGVHQNVGINTPKRAVNKLLMGGDCM